jgi:hypothetical protein
VDNNSIVFGPKSREVRGGRRRLYNEECHNMYYSPNTVMVKNGMIRVRSSYKTLFGTLLRRDQV